MKRVQKVIYDTAPDKVYFLEWDDSVPADEVVFKCVKVVSGGKEITHPTTCRDMHEKSAAANRLKNAVLMPDLIDTMPENEVVVEDDGQGGQARRLKNPPVFREHDGILHAEWLGQNESKKSVLQSVIRRHAHHNRS